MEQNIPDVHHHNYQKIRLWRWLRKYTAFIYKFPYVPILVAVIFEILVLVILLTCYGVHPGGNTNYYRWSGDPITSKWDAYVAAQKQTYGSLLGLFGQTIPLPKQFQLTQMGCVIYERYEQNILEAKVLQEIWKMEDEMHATPGWSDYCFKVPMEGMPGFVQDLILSILDSLKDILSALEPDTYCIAFKSIFTEIKEYLQTTYNVTDPKPEDMTDEVVRRFLLEDETRQARLVGTYIGNDFKGVNGTVSSTRMRTMFPFALPITGYRNKNDREKEQTEKLGKWQLDFIKPAKALQKTKPYGMCPYAAFPFALDFEIADLVLQQVWWLVGSFAFLFLFSIFVMRSFFMAILGTIGVFFPIPCALTIMHGVFKIMYVDVIDVIALFLICGIGADCLFIIFELFRQARFIYGPNRKKRLAYAAQRGLIALATSISASAVSFLALLTSGVRVMNFFGVFSFLLLFFTFFYTFTYYLAILAVWSRRWEKKDSEEQELQTVMNSHLSSTGDTSTTSETNTDLMVDYPYKGIFDCFRKKPVFRIDAAMIDVSKYNIYERAFYNYFSPIIYFYRLPITILALVVAIIGGYFTFQMETKSELTFLPKMHPLQRAYGLALNGFSTALSDFSFVYVWGIQPTPTVSLSDKLTIDQWGTAHFNEINITDPAFQNLLIEAWKLINSRTDLIDPVITETFGASPYDTWNYLVNFDERWFNESLVGPALKILWEYLKLPDPPEKLPYTVDQYNMYGFLWQAICSKYAYEEPDSYVPGTLKAGTVGFSPENYSIQYIGMKANMRIPESTDVETMQKLYNRAMELEEDIKSKARDLHYQGDMGWSTGVAWLSMVTEQMLPQQVVKDVGVAFAFVAIVVLASTWSILYTIFVIVSMTSTVFMIMGILYLTGWKIGCNEAIMISIASGFCADFIIQPMIAISHDYSARSLYGKMQASLVTFCTPVSCALVTTLVAACFLYPCEILLFPPFASFLLGSGIFGIIEGFCVLPAMIVLIPINKRSPVPFTLINEKSKKTPTYVDGEAAFMNQTGNSLIPVTQDMTPEDE